MPRVITRRGFVAGSCIAGSASWRVECRQHSERLSLTLYESEGQPAGGITLMSIRPPAGPEDDMFNDGLSWRISFPSQRAKVPSSHIVHKGDDFLRNTFRYLSRFRVLPVKGRL
jgi:hypothetical protein